MQLDRLPELLEAAGAEALVVVGEGSCDPDLLGFVGPIHVGRSFVLVDRRSEPCLGYFTEMEREEAARTGLPTLGPQALGLEELRAAGSSAGRLLAEMVLRAAAERDVARAGVWLVAGRIPAGEAIELAERLGEAGCTVRSGGELGALLRKRKSASDLQRIREAAMGTCRAFRRVAGLLARAESSAGDLVLSGEPLTAGRLRREIAISLAEGGLEQPHGNILAAGRDGGVPHNAGDDDRVVAAGESLVVDLYPRGALFADCTRTFCVGEPSEPLRRAHELVLELLRESQASARPGVTGWELQEGVCARFEREGFATPIHDSEVSDGYVHNLGHGVGFELHEYPSFRAGAGPAGELAVGDVFTLEPGLYAPVEGGYGVRLEDTVALTDHGLENLTPLPYDLDPRAWSPHDR